MKIDLHSHIVLEDTFGAAGKHGPWIEIKDDGVTYFTWSGTTRPIVNPRQRAELEATGTSRVPHWAVSDPAVRIAAMDEKGIDKMGISISPLLYLYSGEEEIAVPFASIQNDAMAKFCSHAPDRLFFMSALPLQNMEASLAEVDRSVKTLGVKAINIGASNIAGRELDDEYFYPLWQKCEDLDLLVMVHPEATSGIQGQKEQTAAQHLLDYCYQDTLAPLTLMVGGVFDLFPKLKVYIQHGGGFLPYQWRRLEIFSAEAQRLGSQASGPRQIKAKRPIRDYLPNLYLDLLIHDLSSRHMALDLMGPDNIVVGDNFDGADSADGFKFVEEMNLSSEVENKIMGGNAARILNL